MIYPAYYQLKKLLQAQSASIAAGERNPPSVAWLEEVSAAQNGLKHQMLWSVGIAAAICLGVFVVNRITANSKAVEYLLMSMVCLFPGLAAIAGGIVLPVMTHAEMWTVPLNEKGISAELENLAEHSPACKAYQEQVRGHGRNFVELDYSLMRLVAIKNAGVTSAQQEPTPEETKAPQTTEAPPRNKVCR